MNGNSSSLFSILSFNFVQYLTVHVSAHVLPFPKNVLNIPLSLINVDDEEGGKVMKNW